MCLVSESYGVLLAVVDLMENVPIRLVYTSCITGHRASFQVGLGCYGSSVCSYTLSSKQALFEADTITITAHTHTHLTALFPGLPGWAGTRKVKPIWILLKQETESGSGISWAICKSAPLSRQITMPAPHHSVFYRPDALPVAQPTASKH